MNKYSIIDNHYRLLEYKGNDGERFGEVWLAEDLDRPGSEPEYMVISNQRFADKYILIRQLGSGGFGEVWKAKDTVTGVDVALKIHKDGDSVQATNQIVKEYTRVMGIHHDNLLTPTHVNIVGGRTAYLEMELCRKDLTDVELTEEEVWILIRDVASGLKRLAENKKWIEKQQRYVDNPIIHQDIKPANILLRSNGMYAISDFGISKRKLSSLTTNETESQEEGSSPMTAAYAAPERFPRGVGQSVLASDIWSFGAMLYEVVEGNLPFADYGGNSLNAGVVRIPAITRKDYSYELKQLIYDCMAKEPDARPTAAQLQEYAEKAIAGDVRKVTWSGALKKIKADPSRRLSQYKGIPWGEIAKRTKRSKKPKKHKDWGNVMRWFKRNKKPTLVIPAICILVVGGIVVLPHITELFNNAEQKAWRAAKQENTLASYKTFIESNGQSKYLADALKQIVRLNNAPENIGGLRYVLFNAENVLKNATRWENEGVYNGINEEVQDSIRVVLQSCQKEANALEGKIMNYTFDRYYSDSTELNTLKELVNNAIALDDKWFRVTIGFGDSFIDNDVNRSGIPVVDYCIDFDQSVSRIQQWNTYNNVVSKALQSAHESFIKGEDVLRNWRNNTTEEYVPYYDTAIVTVNRFFKEKRIVKINED